MYNYYCP